MTEISNFIDKAIDFTERAWKTNEKTDDMETRRLILDIKSELINAKMALKIRKVIDKRLPFMELANYGNLLDVLYER